MKKENKDQAPKEKKPEPVEEGSGKTIPEDETCEKAPEWSEHARWRDEDQPCDDGRSGNIEKS